MFGNERDNQILIQGVADLIPKSPTSLETKQSNTPGMGETKTGGTPGIVGMAIGRQVVIKKPANEGRAIGVGIDAPAVYGANSQATYQDGTDQTSHTIDRQRPSQQGSMYTLS